MPLSPICYLPSPPPHRQEARPPAPYSSPCKRWGIGMFFSSWEKLALVALSLLLLAGLLFFACQYGRQSALQEVPVLAEEPRGPVLVHVAGRVLRPGLVRLAPGERVAAAIAKAGGAAPGADLDALNLAQEPLDGEKIVVPVRAPVLLAAPVASPAPSRSRPAAAHPGPVNLNRADTQQLDSLPGIGPTLARRICTYRRSLGAAGFTAKEQLLDVPGIGPKKYAAIAPLITL